MTNTSEFRIQVRTDYPAPGWWEVQLVACPIPALTGPKGTLQPSFTRRQLRRMRNRSGWPDQGALIELGSAVWQSLMTPHLAAAFEACLAKSTELGKELQLTVVTLGSEQRDEDNLTPDDPVRLAELPVEALYDAPHGFVATNLETPICRGLQTEPDRVPKQIRLPLRILVAVATPTDKPDAQAEEEVRAVRSALEPLRGKVELELCEQPTRAELAARLQRCDVFHFVGHGGFDPVGSDPTSQAYITLISEKGTESDWLTAHNLANMLHNTEVQLVVFTACVSAAVTPDEKPYPIRAFDGMAQRLLSGISGVTAAVAMQFDMEAVAAVAFSQAFYQHMLEPGRTLTEAVTLARKQISIQMGLGHRAWVTPTAYSRVQDGRVFEVEGLQSQVKPEEMELRAGQRGKLRDALLSCRYMRQPEQRRQIVSDLQKDYKGLTFSSFQDPKLEVAGIIDGCLDFGGMSCLEALLEILEAYEGREANTMKAVWATWKEISG